VDGIVERGAGRGRGLGFATANVRPEAMLPANGVYAVRTRLLPDGPERGGVCNVGVKPTVQESGPVAAEVHLFDHDGADLYGARLRVAFVARLREERRFPSVDALRAQIAADAAAARAILAHA
jgi:riboflavin kinase/FMN adenylyltransferase